MTGAAAACVVALVHLADASASVTAPEWDAMQAGAAAAISAPEIARAIERGGPVAVTALAFGEHPAVLVGWRILATADDAARFAAALEARARPGVGGSTGTGRALRAALRALAVSPCEAERLVVDVVTDGESNVGEPPESVRDEAEAAGVTINGLAIAQRGDPVEWLAANVRTSGGFVLRAETADDLVGALRRKLVQELAAR